jgi:hypothetical protein
MGQFPMQQPKYVSLPKVEACFVMLPFGAPLYNLYTIYTIWDKKWGAIGKRKKPKNPSTQKTQKKIK